MRTDRLTLRPWEPENQADVQAAFDIYRRAEVVEWLSRPAKPWASEDATRDRLRRWAGVSVERPGLGFWAVVPDAVGLPVGTLLLVPLPGAEGAMTDDIEIGWHFHPRHWGQGYATEAAHAVLGHAFNELELPVVNAVAFEGNEASFSVMRRLGMTFRGTTDRWYDTSFEWWAAEQVSPTPTQP
jgi:RimJ/RimL family protein N-acetyltransferase